MIDNQLGGNQRIHALGVAAESLHGIAHSAQIDDRRHSGKVLHEYAGRHVGNLAAWLGLGIPLGQEFDVGGGDVHAILTAEQVFKQNLEAKWKAAQVEAFGFQNWKAIDGVRTAAGGKSGAAGKAIHRYMTFLGLDIGGPMTWDCLLRGPSGRWRCGTIRRIFMEIDYSARGICVHPRS